MIILRSFFRPTTKYGLNRMGLARKVAVGVSMAALFALQFAPLAHAATYYWDSNGAAGFTTITGAWNGTNAFWNRDSAGANAGTFIANPTSADDLNVSAGTTGTITLTGTGSGSSLTFIDNVATIVTGGNLSIGGTGASSGIFLTSAQNAATTVASVVTLNAASTISNAGTGTLAFNGAAAGLNLNGFALVVSGSGTMSFDGNVANVISGAGGITKNGTGVLILSGGTSITDTFTGGVTLNGGAIRFQVPSFFGNNNTTITNGYLGGRFGSGYSWSGLGSGVNQIRITGGTSGFSGEGATTSTFQIGSALSVLTWGSADFNPTVLLLGGDQGMNTNAKGGLNNGIDLAGANRTITSLHSNGDGAVTTGFTVSGVISNGGITKTGVGNIIFGGANTYSGGTTISAGTLTITTAGTLGSNVNTNNITLASGTRLNLAAAANTGSSKTITLTSTANSLSVLTLGSIAAPNATLAQTDINGGLLALLPMTGYTGNLSTALGGKNIFLGSIGTSTFTGAAGTVGVGNGSTYRLGGGARQLAQRRRMRTELPDEPNA